MLLCILAITLGHEPFFKLSKFTVVSEIAFYLILIDGVASVKKTIVIVFFLGPI